MENKVYLIECIDAYTDARYYAEHGEIGGVAGAIGYETAGHARKFRTEKEAQAFIETHLPEWGRAKHRPVAFGFADFGWDAPALAACLQLGQPISEELLLPTANRLHLWRR